MHYTAQDCVTLRSGVFRSACGCTTHVKNGGKLQIPGRSKPAELIVGLSFFPRALGSFPALLLPTDVDMLVCWLLVAGVVVSCGSS